MLQIAKLIAQGHGLAPVLIKRAATVELDWELRQKSRFAATDSSGRSLGVFLPRGTLVRGGDVLVAEDGSLVQVLAAPQPVLVVRPCAQHGSPFDLTRAAYHLGNRHVPIELSPRAVPMPQDTATRMPMARHTRTKAAPDAHARRPASCQPAAAHVAGLPRFARRRLFLLRRA